MNIEQPNSPGLPGPSCVRCAPTRVRRASNWLRVVGFALIIFGGKLWLINKAGSDLPTWDQWDAEGAKIVRPWIEQGLIEVSALVNPHNEHRIIIAKLYALGLLIANSGQWDAVVEMTANAVIHVLAAVALLLVARRCLPAAGLPLFGALLATLFVLPFSWENTLGGFQVSFYFLLLFSIGHIALSLTQDRFSVGWGLGQVCGFVTLACLASGFLSAVTVLVVLAFRVVRERRGTGQQIFTAIFAVVICVIGVSTMTHVPGHAPLKAHNLGEFSRSFLELLVWPTPLVLPWSLFLLSPAVVFVGRLVRRRDWQALDPVLLGLLVWVMLQCLGTAYARGAGGSALSSRYLDLLALHVALGGLFLIREFSGRTRLVVGSLWAIVIGIGLAHHTKLHWQLGVVPTMGQQYHQRQNVRNYLSSGDIAYLNDKPLGQIPYPDATALARFMAPPSIQTAMPPSVRRPLPVLPDSSSSPTPTLLPPTLPAFSVPTVLSTWSLGNHGGVFTWRSAKHPATTLPVLRFRVAGDIGTPESSLRLAVRSDAGEVQVSPESVPHERWKTVNVFRPAGEWWIEVTDADPSAWLAFTNPIELGRASWLSGKLGKWHFIVVLGGAAALVVGSIPSLIRFQS